MQYFEWVVNTDRNEYVSLPTGNGKTASQRVRGEMPLLTYLLLDGSVSGTLFFRRVSDADNSMFERLASPTSEATKNRISDSAEYAGRWAGDSVHIVGDESPNVFNELEVDLGSDEWTDITEGLLEELVEFAGEEYVREYLGTRKQKKYSFL